MSLKKIYSLTETEQSDGVPEPIPQKPRPDLSRLFQGAKIPAGSGPESNGIPRPIGRRDGASPNGLPPPIGEPVDQQTAKIGYDTPTMANHSAVDYDQTIPSPRPNLGGTGAPPKHAGAFAKAPNAPGEDEPLPDLPLEGASLSRAFGYRKESVAPARRTRVKLAELYSIDEMPRPAGSYGPPLMAALKWAKERGGTEFNAREIYRVFRQAGGQPNQPDENKAYQSFQTSLRKLIDPRGRGTPEQPLVVVQAGSKGGHGAATIYSWGAVRPSKTAAAKPTPGATPFDNMQLGPAGAMDQEPEGEPEQAPEAEPQAEPEEPEAQAEPEEEPEQEPEEGGEDAYDWIPEPNEETGVGRSMLWMQENEPDKLQDLLIGVHGLVEKNGTVFDAAKLAMTMFGGAKSVAGSHGIKIAKSAAANLGLQDPDGLL